jgi:hypothetical protein
VFHVPDNRPRVVQGAVTNLDIVPTIAALCGIDVGDLAFEGKSLVPQLFYDGTEERDRIVFAETNAPHRQRAAISARWKLIYHFASNLYELYDLEADPGERSNLAPGAPPALATMKHALQGWMDRVMFVRDPKFNQAYRQLADVALHAAPAPDVATRDQAVEGIDVLGIGVEAGKQLAPGAKLDVHVYFHVREPTTTAYRFQLAAWPVDRRAPAADPDPARIQRTVMRPTAGGSFATDRWKAGDYIRERFTLQIPRDWQGDGVAIGLVTSSGAAKNLAPTGPALASDPDTAVLGVLPMAPVPPTGGSSREPRP